MKSFIAKSSLLLIGAFASCSSYAEQPKETKQNRLIHEQIHEALNACKWSLKSTERPITYLDQTARIIKTNEKNIEEYKQLRDKALAANKEMVVKNWGKRIKECDTKLPVQLKAYKQKYNLAVQKKNNQTSEEAGKFGYKTLYTKLLATLDKIQNSQLSFSDARNGLFKLHNNYTACKFYNIIENYAVYICSGSFVVATEKADNINYIQGSPFSGGYYALTGTKNFTTIFGTQKQAFVFKKLAPLSENKDSE